MQKTIYLLREISALSDYERKVIGDYATSGYLSGELQELIKVFGRNHLDGEFEALGHISAGSSEYEIERDLSDNTLVLRRGKKIVARASTIEDLRHEADLLEWQSERLLLKVKAEKIEEAVRFDSLNAKEVERAIQTNPYAGRPVGQLRSLLSETRKQLGKHLMGRPKSNQSE